jgi:hypothetical protein
MQETINAAREAARAEPLATYRRWVLSGVEPSKREDVEAFVAAVLALGLTDKQLADDKEAVQNLRLNEAAALAADEREKAAEETIKRLGSKEAIRERFQREAGDWDRAHSELMAVANTKNGPTVIRRNNPRLFSEDVNRAVPARPIAPAGVNDSSLPPGKRARPVGDVEYVQ